MSCLASHTDITQPVRKRNSQHDYQIESNVSQSCSKNSTQGTREKAEDP